MVYNIILLLINIFSIGYLLGGDAIAGFLIGFNLVGMHLIMNNIIKGYSLRNSK